MRPRAAHVVACAAWAGVMIASMVLPALGCQTIRDCMHAHQAGEDPLVLPEENILLGPDAERQVWISGVLPEGTGDGTPVRITVTSPDGRITVLEVHSKRDGLFMVPHLVYGDRNQDGAHAVLAEYMHADGDTEHAEWRTAGSGTIHVLFDRGVADHTAYITGMAGMPCRDRPGECLDYGDAVVHAGQDLEWFNEDDEPHWMRARAVEAAQMSYGGDAHRYLDTGLILPDHSAVAAFDVPSAILYSCVLHPWMEGVIEVKDDTRKYDMHGYDARGNDAHDDTRKDDTSRDDTHKDDTRGDAEPRVTLDGPRAWHNAGDVITLEIRHAGAEWIGASVRVYDEDQNPVYRGLAGPGEHALDILSQPTWTPGAYHVVVDPRGALPKANVTLHIEAHPHVRCIGAENQTIHGTYRSGCYAGLVDGVVDHDTIRIDGKKITLTVSNTDKHAAQAAGRIAELCMPGAVAVVDLDGGLVRDSRSSSEFATERAGYAAVHCGDVSVNEMLLLEGLADADRTGCLSTEFAWGRCIRDHADRTIHDGMGGAEGGAQDNCMIALAARGTALEHDVQLLREYRSKMAGTMHGALILDTVHAVYYAVSPHVADMMRHDETVSHMVRGMLYILMNPGGWLG